jgi:hypothetical protein
MFTDSSALILLIPALVGIFILIARLDLYLAKRRNQVALERYMAELDSQHSPGCRA